MVEISGRPEERDNGTDNSPTRPPYYTCGVREIQRIIVSKNSIISDTDPAYIFPTIAVPNCIPANLRASRR